MAMKHSETSNMSPYVL